MNDITPTELKSLQNANEKIIVDYWSETCGPCIRLLTILGGIEESYQNVRFVKINAREYVDHLFSLGINRVPTVIFFDGGNLVHTAIGQREESYYTNVIEELGWVEEIET
jgi:thioredoxin 1